MDLGFSSAFLGVVDSHRAPATALVADSEGRTLLDKEVIALRDILIRVGVMRCRSPGWILTFS